MISSDHDSDSDVESVSTGLSVAHVVFTPTKRPPSPGTSDEDEDFEHPDRYLYDAFSIAFVLAY